MLLSAVSVLVVAQSSSEIPEGLMNDPVHLIYTDHGLSLHFSNTGCRTWGSSLLRSVSACGRERQPLHTWAVAAGNCEYYYFWYNLLYVRNTIPKSTTIMKITWNKSGMLPSDSLPIYDLSSRFDLTGRSVEKKIGPLFYKTPRLRYNGCKLTE